MTNVDLPNALPLSTNLSTGAMSTSLLVQPTLSLLAAIATGQVSLSQTGAQAPVTLPANYAGA